MVAKFMQPAYNVDYRLTVCDDNKTCLLHQEPAEPADPDGHQSRPDAGHGVHQPAGQLRRS